MVKLKFLIFVVFFILLAGTFVLADFEISDASHSIQKSYGVGEKIKGWFEISFEGESSSSVFSSAENSISLKELLELNSATELCELVNCVSKYDAGGEQIMKSYSMLSGNSKIVGFKLKDRVTDVEFVNFSLVSDAGVSCSNQIEIDLFNDGEIDFGNTRASEQVGCTKTYGCFNSGRPFEYFTLGNNLYCQEIEIGKYPGFNLGAWVKNEGEVGLITMEIFGVADGNGRCDLPEASSSGGEISCTVSYAPLEEKKSFVCIYDWLGGDNKIKGYSDSAGCGFYKNPPNQDMNSYARSASYGLFIEGKKFAVPGQIELSTPEILANKVEMYLQEVYGLNIDCPVEGCFVPIKIISNSEQTVNLKDLKVKYQTSSGLKEAENLFDLSEVSSNVDSDFVKLYLGDANFSVSDDFGGGEFVLKFKGEEIFSEAINIEKVPVIGGLSPRIAIAGYPTEFRAGVEFYGMNVSKYKWDFGNNDTFETTENKVEYMYDEIGIFNLEVALVDSNSRESSKIFQINVTSPKDAIEGVISDKLDGLTKVKNQLNEFPQFYVTALNSILNLTTFENKLTSVKARFSSNSSDEQCIILMKELFEIKIPKSIVISKEVNSFLFFPEENFIDKEIIEEISGSGFSGNSEDFVEKVLAWNSKNMDIKISFKELSAEYDGGNEPLLSVFDFTFNKKKEFDFDYYVVVHKVDNLNFGSSGLKGNGTYFYSDSSLTQLSFSTTENLDFSNVPLFVSPDVSNFVVELEEFEEEDKSVSKWVWFILVLIFLLAVAIGVFIFLKIWYKKKYEKYLFPNKNDLYNLITFVQTEKGKGLSGIDIRSKLKRSSWTGEQANYVVKKYAGKKIGMFGFGFGKKVVKRMPVRKFGFRRPGRRFKRY